MTSTVARDGPGGGDPIAAWDLPYLRKLYEEFVAGYQPLLERLRRGGVGSAEALIARTAVMDTWRNFPNLDPELPDELLPQGWPRRRAREVFAEVYDALGPLGELRVRQVLAEFAPELAGLVRHHTTGSAPRRGAPASGAGAGHSQ